MTLLNYSTTITDKAAEFAQVEYKKNDTFHSWAHIQKVMKRATEIIEKLQQDIDYEELKLAIILHDIDYHSEQTEEKNYKNHVDNSVVVAQRFLSSLKYPEAKLRKVKQIMLEHSTPHRKKLGEAKSLEGKIIYDSDKSIFITTPELYKKYFPLLYLEETKGLVQTQELST